MPPFKLLFIALVLGCCGSFHGGYQIVAINSLEESIRNFLNESFFVHYNHFVSPTDYTFAWPVLVNAFMLGALLGSFIIHPLLKAFSARRCFLVVASLGALGWSCEGISFYVNSFECFAIGRFIAGLACSISLGVQPAYFTEISGTEHRGLINSITGLLMQGSFFLGCVLALPNILGGSSSWPWLFWIELFTTVPVLCLFPFLPESPKVLLANNDVNGAKKALVFFGRSKCINKEIEEIKREVSNRKTNVSLIEILKTQYLRKGLCLGCSVAITGELSGLSAIVNYSTTIFTRCGLSMVAASYATVGIMFSLGSGAVLSSIFVDKFGRRPLLLLSNLVMICCNVAFITFSQIGKRNGALWPVYVCIAIIVIFTFMFAFGPGVLMWFISAELMPENARSTALSVATVSACVSVIISSQVFFPLSSAVGDWSFLMFIIPLVLGTIYLYFHLPETKNKEIVDIVKTLGYNKDNDKQEVAEEEANV